MQRIILLCANRSTSSQHKIIHKHKHPLQKYKLMQTLTSMSVWKVWKKWTWVHKQISIFFFQVRHNSVHKLLPNQLVHPYTGKGANICAHWKKYKFLFYRCCAKVGDSIDLETPFIWIHVSLIASDTSFDKSLSQP